MYIRQRVKINFLSTSRQKLTEVPENLKKNLFLQKFYITAPYYNPHNIHDDACLQNVSLHAFDFLFLSLCFALYNPSNWLQGL